MTVLMKKKFCNGPKSDPAAGLLYRRYNPKRVIALWNHECITPSHSKHRLWTPLCMERSHKNDNSDLSNHNLCKNFVASTQYYLQCLQMKWLRAYHKIAAGECYSDYRYSQRRIQVCSRYSMVMQFTPSKDTMPYVTSRRLSTAQLVQVGIVTISKRKEEKQNIKDK